MLYLDCHDTATATAEDVAQLHIKDLQTQGKYGARYLTYWFDYKAGHAFCLVDAPSKEAAEAVHREAHGQIAARVIEVDPRRVEDFLGNIEEVVAGEVREESAFRAILFTDMKDSTSLTQRLGDAGVMKLLRAHNTLVREALQALDGREVKHTGDGIMASFSSVARAVDCAVAVQRKLADYNLEHAESPICVRIGLSAGEPVTEHDDLFGAAVQLASRICDTAEGDQILASSAVRDLCIGKGFPFAHHGDVTLKGFDEPVRLYNVGWRD